MENRPIIILAIAKQLGKQADIYIYMNEKNCIKILYISKSMKTTCYFF